MHEFDTIFTYSRQDAIADGEQICISEIYPSDCRVFKYPVYLTRKVMILVEESHYPSGVVWDLCCMAAYSPSRTELNGSTVKFSVIVENTSIKPDFIEDGCPCYKLIAQVGATDFDDPAPAVTIMFPEEM